MLSCSCCRHPPITVLALGNRRFLFNPTKNNLGAETKLLCPKVKAVLVIRTEPLYYRFPSVTLKCHPRS